MQSIATAQLNCLRAGMQLAESVVRYQGTSETERPWSNIPWFAGSGTFFVFL